MRSEVMEKPSYDYWNMLEKFYCQMVQVISYEARQKRENKIIASIFQQHISKLGQNDRRNQPSTCILLEMPLLSNYGTQWCEGKIEGERIITIKSV